MSSFSSYVSGYGCISFVGFSISAHTQYKVTQDLALALCLLS